MAFQNQIEKRLRVYNIKAISHLVGLLPVTLRAWERRYGIPTPRRGNQGYRLYSEYDLYTLHWLKTQIDAGFSISRAIENLNELRQAGKDPVEPPVPVELKAAASINYLVSNLQVNLLHFNESRATEIMHQSLNNYTLDRVLSEILQPIMVEIGEKWHRGELPIAVEHYITQFFMQHLSNMLSGFSTFTHPEIMVAACAPGEMHQIGLLTLVVMLRWRGWDVRYLGPDLKMERLGEALDPVKPRLLLFTATRLDSATVLKNLSAVLKQFPLPHPLIVLGGQAFRIYRLPEEIPARYIDGSLTDSIIAIENLVKEQNQQIS